MAWTRKSNTNTFRYFKVAELCLISSNLSPYIEVARDCVLSHIQVSNKSWLLAYVSHLALCKVAHNCVWQLSFQIRTKSVVNIVMHFI